MSVTMNALATALQADGYRGTVPDEPKGYTFEATKGGEQLAVKLTEYKAPSNVSVVRQFQEFLGLDGSKLFTGGCFISASGFSPAAMTHVTTEEPKNLRFGTIVNGKLNWNYPEGLIKDPQPPKSDPNKAKLRYFGVFTCKGGVGKTTVSAHLAGAFALMGFDVILVDLDPDKNLRKLFLNAEDGDDASLFIPGRRGQPGASITVLNHDEWDETAYPDVKIVVCDCSPVLSENPKELVAKFDYCIIPTTMNPLGVAKKADVITRTFGQIRAMNSKAEMFAVINGYDATAEAKERNLLLLELLKTEISKYTAQDAKCKFIDPEDAKIRYSTALFYWGIHIVRKSPPELAFKEVAGRSYPRVDFLELADYLENHTDIEALKRTGV